MLHGWVFDASESVIKKKIKNAAFSFTKSPSVVCVAVFRWGFFPKQVFFLFCPCLVLAGFF